MIFVRLFFIFAYINILGFGNGLTMLPIFQEQLVTLNHWITFDEFINMIPISQATPGPLVVNIATFSGVKTAGVFGGMVATIGVTITTAVISLLLVSFYQKHKEVLFIQELMNILRPITIAFISVAAISVFRTTLFADNAIDVAGVFLFVAGLIAIRKYKVNFALALLSCGVVNVLIKLVLQGLFTAGL